MALTEHMEPRELAMLHLLEVAILPPRELGIQRLLPTKEEVCLVR